jgi:peptidoglycan hydrolase-like protein with peptidoglycan-binding domain
LIEETEENMIIGPLVAKHWRDNLRLQQAAFNYPAMGVKYPDDAEAIRLLQQALQILAKAYGSFRFIRVAVTGLYDAQTKKAVQDYQKVLALNPDGKAGNQTLNSMDQYLFALTGGFLEILNGDKSTQRPSPWSR